MQRSAARTAAFLAALALVAGACIAPPPAQAPPAVEQPQPGGRVIQGSISDVRTLQPALATDTVSRTAIDLLYASLTQTDPNTGEIKANLGRWTVSADALSYSWEMEEKAVWSDGKPIVGDDFLMLVRTVARSKKSVRKGLFTDIEGFGDYAEGKAISISGIKTSGKKFTVRFSKVFCPALADVFGFLPPIPAHVFGKHIVDSDPSKNADEAPENNSPTATSGPFTFKEWRLGDQVILARNPSYWKGAPHLDEYVVKVVPDATALAAGLKAGELNYTTIDPKDLEDIERQSHLKVNRYQQLFYTYIGWNVRSRTAPWLADKRIRQALAYGLDMDAVIKAILFGQGTRMVSHHPPPSWAFPQTGLNAYPYDRSKAEELIRSAGYTKGADGFYQREGKSLAFSMLTNSGNKVRETLVQVAVEQYRLIGVKATPKLEAFESVLERLTGASPELEAWIVAWSLVGDPDPHGIWHSTSIPDRAAGRTGQNFGGFAAPGLDEAIEKARTGDCSLAARKKHYETFNKILNEEQPYNFGFSPNTLLVTARALRNVAPGPHGVHYNVERWWLAR